MAEPPVTDTQLREQLDIIKAHYDELLAEAHHLHGLAFNKCREVARDFSGLKKTMEEQKTLIASQEHQIADLRFQLGIVRQDDHISDLRFKVGLIRQDVDNTMREDKWLRRDLWNRFNYLAERQDKVDADMNTTRQDIITLGQHHHACDANFTGLRTTAMGLLNATRSDLFRLMDEVHTVGWEVRDLKEWAEWAEFDPTREQDTDGMDTPSEDSVDDSGNYRLLR